MRLPFAPNDPAEQPLTGVEQRRLAMSTLERLAKMEDTIAHLVRTVAGLKTELAATRQRYEANRAALIAGHQADLEAVIADVEAMTAEAASMETDAPAPGSLAADALPAADSVQGDPAASPAADPAVHSSSIPTGPLPDELAHMLPGSASSGS